MMQKGELREQRFHTGTVELNYPERSRDDGPQSGFGESGDVDA